MSNLRVVSENVGQTAVLTASSEVGDLLVGNLQLSSKTLIWRTAGTSASVTATYPAQNTACVSLPICNLTSTATMQVEVYFGGGVVYDTGAILCCEYTTIEKIDFADGPLNANTFNYGGGSYATVFYPSINSDKIVATITDTNNTNGYIEASYIVVGDTWSPVLNCDYNAALTFKDTTKSKRSDSGDLRVTRGARYKSLAFSLGLMSAVDRIALTNIFVRNGSSIETYVSIFPESPDAQEKQVYQVYGFITKQSGVKRHKYSRDQSSITIEEI